jgi:hypothetical protein
MVGKFTIITTRDDGKINSRGTMSYQRFEISELEYLPELQSNYKKISKIHETILKENLSINSLETKFDLNMNKQKNVR